MEANLGFWNRRSANSPNLDQRLAALEERASISDPISISDPSHWTVHGGGGHVISPDTAMQQTVVFACVKVLAETVGSLPYQMMKILSENNKEVARDFYLYPLLHDSPNNFQTSLEYFEMLVGHLALRGNAYSFIERDQAGRILRLIPIHPDRIVPKVADPIKQTLVYEYTYPGAVMKPYQADQIWHLKLLSSDGFIGLSPIAQTRRAVELTKTAEDHGVAYFANGGRMSGVARLPGKISDEAHVRLKNSLNEGMTGENKFKVHVFEEGMEWQAISLSNEDSQYLETRRFQVEEIARIFRVPTILIGHSDKAATFASAEQFMRSFVIHTLTSWLVRIEQSAKMHLLTEQERKSYYLNIKVQGLLRGDNKTRSEYYSKAISSRWMNPNEVRALEDMNPYDGGDDFANPAIDTVPKPAEPKPGDPDDDDIIPKEPGEE